VAYLWRDFSSCALSPPQLLEACPDALDAVVLAVQAGLKKDNLDWQNHRLMIYGKGGPYGTKSKRRIVPLTSRVQPLIEGHLALYDEFGIMLDCASQRHRL
jgi:integrase/recombinase XerD